MKTLNLEAKVRDLSSSAKLLRRENMIPVQYYGAGKKNMSLAVDYQSFRKVFRESGENTVIDLNIGEDKSLKVLVQDVQYNPITDEFIHIDFISVDMNKEVEAKVPLKFTGEAPAVKNLGGIVTTQRDEIEVRCLPGDLVKEIEVDISDLVDFNAAIFVKDISFPEALTVLTDPEMMIINVVPPKVEVEEEPTAAEGEEGEEGAEGEEGEAPKEGEAPAEGGEAPKEGGGEAKPEGGEKKE